MVLEIAPDREATSASVSAAAVSVDTSAFDNNLLVSDDDMQKVADRLDDLVSSAAALPRLVATSHGLTASDVGKPINGDGSLLNDTNGAHALAGIVTSIIDANTIEYAPPGTTLNIATTLFSGGITLPADRFWDWDLSQNSNAGLYVKDPPLDAFDWMTQILIVNSTSGGNANVLVLDGEIL